MTNRARTSEELAKETEQMMLLVEAHPRCNERCSGKYEHSEVMWLYAEAMPLDDRQRYMAMGSGLMAAIQDRFGGQYLEHDMTPLVYEEVAPQDSKVQRVSQIAIDNIVTKDDTTTMEMLADHDASLPEGIDTGDLVGYRVRFAVPWKLNTIRRLMIDHNPAVAAKAGIVVSGTAE